MSEGPERVWDHATVYDALVNRGNKEIPTEHNRYVHLYPQDVNCAILYAPGGTFDGHPLHFSIPGDRIGCPQNTGNSCRRSTTRT